MKDLHLKRIDLPALELAISVKFSSATSACFDVVSQSKGLGVNAVLGWMGMHYPCEGHVQAYFQGVLPERCLNPDALKQIISTLFARFDIPPNTTYEIQVVSAKSKISLSSPVDENGMTDRIETTRKFSLPKQKNSP